MEEALTNRQFINSVVAVVGDEKEPRFNRSALKTKRCSTG